MTESLFNLMERSFVQLHIAVEVTVYLYHLAPPRLHPFVLIWIWLELVIKLQSVKKPNSKLQSTQKSVGEMTYNNTVAVVLSVAFENITRQKRGGGQVSNIAFEAMS